MCAALGSEEANIAGMVLAAAICAARDVDANSTNLGKPFLFKCFTDCFCKATGLRDCNVAGVGARASNNIACKLCTWLGHANSDKSLIQNFKLFLGQCTEYHVLAVGQTHIGVQVALDLCKSPELICSDIAKCCVSNCRYRTVGRSANNAGLHPALKRII